MLAGVLRTVLMRLFPSVLKRRTELSYWRWRKHEEGTLGNAHYQQFFTTHFGLTSADYAGKRVLDIGCGPRGSLEWADEALERVGLDPLARSYAALGADRHRMRYVAAPSEAIPFPDGHFDVVSCFNALDHVDDVSRTVAEIARVTRRGGAFLLLSDVCHDPTPTEPQVIGWDVVGCFSGSFRLIQERHYERVASGLYQSIEAAVPYDHSNPTRRYGVVSCRFERV